MKAVWYDRTGPATEVLQFGHLPDPHPGPGEVVVELHASGVNPADCNRRRGAGHAMEFPRVITHSDGAGIVVALGDGTPAHWLGRRVWLYNGQRGRAFGTAAEFIALDHGLLQPLADDVSFDVGACLGIPAMTAFDCVFGDGPVSGLTVLVTGGAGAVGRYAVQLARWGGARVLTTVSSEGKAAHARLAGPDVVIDYRRGDVVAEVMQATNGEGVDRIVDVDLGGNLAVSLQVLKASGQLVSYASRGDAEPKLPFGLLARKCISLRAMLLPALPLARRVAAQQGLTRWLAEGPRQHAVGALFPLSQTVQAQECVELGAKLGTVVVRPQQG